MERSSLGMLVNGDGSHDALDKDVQKDQSRSAESSHAHLKIKFAPTGYLWKAWALPCSRGCGRLEERKMRGDEIRWRE